MMHNLLTVSCFTTGWSLAEVYRNRVSTAVNNRISPETRARIEVRLFGVGDEHEFIFHMVSAMPLVYPSIE